MADDTPEETKFKVDYALSSRSTCTSSRQLIPQGSLRIGVMVQSPKFDGMYPQWHKFEFFEDIWVPKHPGELKSLSQISGLDKLKFEDVQKIKAMLTKGDSTAKLSKKEMTEEEKALEKESKMIWALKEQLQQNVTSPEIKALLEAHGQPTTGKIFGGPEKLLGRLVDAMLFGWLPNCPECKTGDLIYSRGKYRCTGHISEFARCTYETTELKRKAWTCDKGCDNDFLKEFKFKEHKKVMAVVDGEVEEINLNANVTVSTSSSSSSGEANMQVDASVSVTVAPQKPFEDLSVGFQGKLSRTLAELEKEIKEHGGKVAKKISKDTNVLVSNDVEVEGSAAKIKDAMKFGIPIVKEDWIWKSIELKRKLSTVEMQEFCMKNAPTMSAEEKAEQDRLARKRKAAEIDAKVSKSASPTSSGPASATSSSGGLKSQPGDEPKVKKLKLKSGERAAVEPDTGLEDEAHVLDVRADEIYNVTLNQADVTTGRNSYYILQLLESNDKKKYWVFRKWGRVGTSTIGGTKLEKFSNLASAKSNFCSLYEEKSGNEWSNRNSFVKKPGKMMQIEIEYGSNKPSAEVNTGDYKGSLAPSIQDLIRLLFDVKVMNDALLELQIDTEKMPLGKLSERTIKDGYKALNAIQTLLKQDPAPPNLQTLLVSETNRFYNIIPHAFGEGKKPGVLDTEEKLKEKIVMMDALLELEVTSSILKAGSTQEGEHPIDTNYKKLKAELVAVDKKSDEFQLVAKYVANTHGHTHTMYTLELQDLFRLDREGEEERWKPNAANPNRRLLWHGSRLANWVGIVSQGLRIAPPEAPSTGYMFGKGVYFADMVTKSSNYCFTTSEHTTGLMALSEVALGEMYKLTGAKYMDQPPKGFQSTFGQGQHHPDPAGAVTLPNGTLVPCGKSCGSGIKTSLMYNEFIVYDVAQVRMRYLLRLKFNYKCKAGTFF